MVAASVHGVTSLDGHLAADFREQQRRAAPERVRWDLVTPTGRDCHRLGQPAPAGDLPT
jgi:hypothetical protein